MLSNLITPPDILNNGSHSVIIIDPEQHDVDAVIKFCQYSEQTFNVYVYTPNMNNLDWLNKAINASDTVIVNSRSDEFKKFCLLDKSYYYGDCLYLENQKKLEDPLHYFAAQIKSNK